MLDVVLQLGDQSVDAVELALAAQEVGEAHFGALAVDVAVEVEQVGLEQRVVGVLVERRPPAEVERARVDVAVRAARTSRRTPRRRGGRPRWAPRRWRSGKPSSRPRWSPTTTIPRASNGRPSSSAASSTCPPASARRMAVELIDSSTPSARWHELQRLHLEVPLGPELAQHGDVAFAAAAEVEVLADDDDRRVEAVDQHATNEMRRLLARLRLVEVDDDGRVEARRREQLELLVEIGQQLRRRLGPNDRRRMTIERHHGRACPGRRGELGERRR